MTLDSDNPNDLHEGSETGNASGADAPAVAAPVDTTTADDAHAASAAEPSDAHTPAAATKDKAVSTASSGGMKTPTKVIAVLILLAVIGGVLLFVQGDFSSGKAVKLSKHDMEVVFQEMLPPQRQEMIASSPEKKKELVDMLKNILAVAQVAEREGFDKRPEVQSQIAIQTDMSLNQAYFKKNPDMKVSEDQVSAYYQAHPNEFDSFIQSDPRLAQQAQGQRREELKKNFGQLKVVADLARKDKLDQDEVTRLQLLIVRGEILHNAYLTEFEKTADKLVSDADIEQYYNEHKDEFDEVRVRHILIATQAPPGGDPSKVPSKEEARKKAQAVLERARKGEDFVKLVEENSDDIGSKSKGGEYVFARKSRMVPAFEEASFNLKPGEISDLVETEFGYHIIKLEERTAGQPNDEKTRQKITDKVKADKIESHIKEIAQNSTVEVPEDFDATPKPVEAAPMTSGGARAPDDNAAPKKQ